MKKQLVLLVAVLMASLAVGLMPTTTTGTRVLVVNDLGTCCDSTIACMQAHGLIVEPIAAKTLLESDGAALRADHDVIWILPDAEYDVLRQLAARDAALQTFAQAGGTVVLLGIDACEFRLDVAPGGVDGRPANGGAVQLCSPHPITSGIPPAGQALCAAELDPAGTGGSAVLINAPSGCHCISIAANASGAVLCEYELGDGRVIMSLLDMVEPQCLDNVLLYVASLHP